MQDGSVCYYINEFNKKEMKMKKYQNPEMEVIKLNNRQALLAGSGEEPGTCVTQTPSDD